MDEETMATELGLSAEDLKDPAKITEAAEKIEAENKAAKEPVPADDKTAKVVNDQLGRLAKAIEKRNALKNPETVPNTTLNELDIDNRVFAKLNKLSPEQIDVLNKYQNLSGNEGKSFEDIHGSIAVQAEMKAIQSTLDAENELDANANEDQLRATNNDIVTRYEQSGKEPTNDRDMAIVVAHELSKVPGLIEY